MIISRSIHVGANGIISFYFMANIPLYIHIYTTSILFHVCMYEYIHMHLYVCIYVYAYLYHIFFIHSSVDGHLGYFHVLAIVNSAAMNIGVHVSFQIKVFSGYMPQWNC